MAKKKTLGRYMDLKTDFAFKYVFANESDKRLLINLLNVILSGRSTIVDITYLLSEQLGNTEEERKAFFDVYCTNERGERFVIEMQIAKHENFIDRCLYYTTFPIQKQAVKGEEWNYRLEPVFFIAIMDFTLWDNNPDYINYYSLMNEKKHEVISKKVMLISIELGKFLKTLEELETDLDRWLYCFKHLPELEKQPKEMQGEIFNILYRTTALYNLTDKNMKAYNKSVTEYADVRFAMACSREEGYEKGIERGIERGIEKGIEKGIESQNLQITKNLIKRGLSLELISDVTGLTPEQIRRIR